MSPAAMVAIVLASSLVVYVLTAGADFGGGVWDLLAGGPRAVRQRRAIALTIAPIWEANHVWMILALVLTFVAFPRAYAAIGTTLHVPITLMLVGIVLRGSAFVFRAYDYRHDAVQRRWSVVFASASAFTPVMLGILVGAIASGNIDPERPEYLWSWLAPFPVAVGLLTLAIFAFLAAVYLTLAEHVDDELREDFRLRGLIASGAVFLLAWTAFFLAKDGAPVLWEGLWASTWSLPFQALIGLVGLSCIGALALRRYRLARLLAGAEAVLVVGGWARAQWPWVLPGKVHVADAAPDHVLNLLLLVLLIGGPPLLAAYIWLVSVFSQAPPPPAKV